LRNTIKRQLASVLPRTLLDDLPRSFDVLGSREGAVAIIEVPEVLRNYEAEIAKAIMTVHGNVKSVLGKESERRGEYRLRELRLIGGDPDTEVIHKESGCRFKLDPRETYFSTRESTERERVNCLVHDGENILVMFSGVAPFPICIARAHPYVTVTCIEVNPVAHRYAIENIVLNKVQDRVIPLLGDVREICPKLGKTYDRVLMPLPKGAHMFLDTAIPLVKKKGILHFYHWAPENDLYGEATQIVKNQASQLGREAEFLSGNRVSLYSPRVYKIRADFRLS
jgi:tRNA (guanine37-N1)-methyltransferase